MAYTELQDGYWERRASQFESEAENLKDELSAAESRIAELEQEAADLRSELAAALKEKQ